MHAHICNHFSMSPLPNCTKKGSFPFGHTSKFTLCTCFKVRPANGSHVRCIPACKYSRTWSTIIINIVSANCQFPVGKNLIWIWYKLDSISIELNSFLALKFILAGGARQYLILFLRTELSLLQFWNKFKLAQELSNEHWLNFCFLAYGCVIFYIVQD